jgi:hypothetical protein
LNFENFVQCVSYFSACGNSSSFLLQYPPEETSKGSGRKLEYAGQLPRLSTVEKNFLAQLITNPTKEVNVTYKKKFKQLFV